MNYTKNGKKRHETKTTSAAAYHNIAIEQRPLGDGKESSYCGIGNRVIAHIHTESSRLGLLIAVVAAGLGVLDVCVAVWFLVASETARKATAKRHR